MTDYIEWLLEQQDEEREEDQTPWPEATACRAKGAGAAQEGDPDTEAEKTQKIFSEVLTEVARAPQGREPLRGRGLEAGSEAGRLPSARRDGLRVGYRSAEFERNNTGIKALGRGTIGLLPRGFAAALQVEDVPAEPKASDRPTGKIVEGTSAVARDGGGLYRVLRRSAERARYGVGRRVSEHMSQPVAERPVRGMDAVSLDRAFQRDARRYDGAFTFY